MNFYAISALFNTVVCTFLVIILLIKKDKPKSATYFNFFIISILVWAISYFFWQTTTNYDTAYFWVQMLMVGAIFTSPSLFLFSTSVAGTAKKMMPLTIVAYIMNSIFAVLHFTHSHLFIAELRDKIGVPLFPTAGKYYWVFLIQWFFWFLFSFYQLYLGVKNAEEKEKGANKVILYTTILVLVFSGIFNYFLWYDIPIPPITTGMVGIYGVTVVLLLLRGKFYKLNLLYFEFFAGIITLLSLTQFILGNKLNPIYLNSTIFAILILISYFLIKVGRNEQKHLEQIDKFNLSLKNTIKNIINSIDDAVLIISNNRQNMIEVNQRAVKLFGYNPGEELPVTFANFIRGKINQSLISSLRYYLEDGKKIAETEILIPEKQSIIINFSPFTLEQENDATIIIIRKI